MPAERTRAEAPDDEPAIIMTRRLDAPPAAVFRAWTEPDLIARWWGPDGYTITILDMDVRVGGIFRFTMHGPDGTDYPNRITYREIVSPERLHYLHDSDVDDDPRGFLVSVTFAPDGDGTLLTMRLLLPSFEAREAVNSFGAMELGQQTIEKLAAFLDAGG